MNFLKIIRIAYARKDTSTLSEESVRSDIMIKVSTAIILSAASLVLTILNIIIQNWFMTVSTAVLSAGFALCAVLCGIFHKRTATVVIMAILIGCIFSVFALTGENEGFAILWILLVPPTSMNLIGLRTGTVLSAYFQVFLFVLFSPPVRPYVSAFYSDTFQIRFPVLYMTAFAATLILSIQKEYYFRKTEQMAYMDALTQLNNRRYYDLKKAQLANRQDASNVTFISIDINRLKFTNDTMGHKAGDELIIASADCVRRAFPDAECVCRIGGDEFAVITYTDGKTAGQQVETLRSAASAFRGTYITEILLSIGWASGINDSDGTVSTLEKAADAAMYQDKADFYEQTGYDRRK